MIYFAVTGKVDEKATQLHAIASLKVLLDATKPQNGAATSSTANHVQTALKAETALAPVARQPSSASQQTTIPATDVPNGVASALAEMNLQEAVQVRFIFQEENLYSTYKRIYYTS